ncbi:MAG: tyrosine-type recombinase/integrase, partial [Candidatus Kariarchaeaceae archaeon]
MEHPDQNNDRLKEMKIYLVAFYDDIRKLKDSDKCTVRLRVTHKSRPYYYSTPIQVTPEEYLKIAGPKPRGAYKDKRDLIWEMLKKANDILLEMGDFDAYTFKNKLRGEKNDWSDIWAVFDYQIKALEKKGRYNYAVTYRTSKRSFEMFSKEKGKKASSFDDITKKWLEAYEEWANEEIVVNEKKKKRLSQSSVGINTRNLKVLVNLAIKNGGTIKNPFLEYSPPSPRNIKKALSKQDVKKIFDHEPGSEVEGFYRDLWIFSYLCNGMNISDILRLKYKNIDGDDITFIRQKTSGKRNLKPVQADYSEKAKEIVERWGQKPISDEAYIFPV